jgi:hypothetical protein
MKNLILLGAVVVLATSIGAQSTPDDRDALPAAINEVQAQQIEIADNQAKIDAMLATVTESVRIARIYASRGGR